LNTDSNNTGTNMLVTLDHVLTPDEVARAREMLRQSDWCTGQLTAGTQATQVKSNQQVAENALHLPALRQMVLHALHREPLFFTSALPLKVLPPLFNRYTEGANSYGSHVDGAIRYTHDSSNCYIRSDISATLFLTDPDEYEGGVLTIQDSFGTHGIKLKAGSLVIYPSSSVHSVTPVTQGARMACFMFIQSMVRDAGQRRMLYEMDMALIKLRQQVGETEPIISLTGTYHNLLRCWAQV
jgi:PKHD-type hydroxylase